MSTWPPELPLNDWTNESVNRDRHPDQHNVLANAIATLVAEVARKSEVFTQLQADARFVRTVNGLPPDVDGNVVVVGSGGGGAVDSVNGQTGTVVLSAGDVGAAAATDARLSDQRTPLDGSVTTAKIAAGGLAPTAVTGTAVITSDSRLTDSRPPINHASSHASGGSDPVTPAAIGALTQTGADGRYLKLTDLTTLKAQLLAKVTYGAGAVPARPSGFAAVVWDGTTDPGAASQPGDAWWTPA